MRGRFVILLGLMLIGPPLAHGADPVAGTPTAEGAEVTTPAVAPPAQVLIEKPKPAERPKPVEKPRPIVESAQPPEVTLGKPIESAPAAAPAPAPADSGTAGQGEVNAGYSFGCLALSFAMLIIGIAAGFIGRHFLSRHKLGGMTVRIGTWRGIP